MRLPGPGHRAECDAGREMIDRDVRLLEWVLGDSGGMNDLVAHILTAAALR